MPYGKAVELRYSRVYPCLDRPLLGRSQRVVVGGEASDWVPAQSGVLQGTVLGPVLFLGFLSYFRRVSNLL